MAGFYKVGRDTAQVPINFDSWTLNTYAPIHYAVESSIGLVNEHVDVRGEHAAVIREVGRASTVLLKNTNNALPLTGQEKQVAIIGEDAGSNSYGANGCSDRGCNNGTTILRSRLLRSLVLNEDEFADKLRRYACHGLG
jgi:beta-glucosidase